MDNKPLKIVFKNLGRADYGGYGHKADVQGDAPHGTKDKRLGKDSDDAMTIPISPEQLEFQNSVDVNGYKTQYFSELVTMSGLKLRNFTITSFLPYDTGHNYGTDIEIKPQKFYLEWIQRAMQRKCILLVAIYGDIDYIVPFQCIIKEFNYTLLPNKDVSYQLAIIEYIDYRNFNTERDFVIDGTDLVIKGGKKSRDNLEGEITVGSIVRVVRGFVNSNSTGSNRVNVATISRMFQFRPEYFINIKNYFDAKQLGKEINTPEDLEWVVCGMYSHSDMDTGAVRNLYEMVSSNALSVDNILNIHIKSLTTDDDGWVSKDQLALVR